MRRNVGSSDDQEGTVITAATGLAVRLPQKGELTPVIATDAASLARLKTDDGRTTAKFTWLDGPNKTAGDRPWQRDRETCGPHPAEDADLSVRATGHRCSAAMAVSARHSQTFGAYEVTSTLASGGMGSVYLAVQRGVEGFERVVALKQIHPHLMQNRTFCEMFIDEARIASRINHGCVCRVYDFGESPDGYFITMEYLEGEPLSRVLRALKSRTDLVEDPRYPLIVARIIAGIAEGLHAAHTLKDEEGERLEVVHRDVSPQNIFVLYDGTVRVTDFGIAHARQRVHQTRGETLKGKFSYMAPEQVERSTVDHRADIWSLGVVLWEALTLRRLFRGDNEADTLMRVLSKAVPLPSKFNPNIPPSLDAIVRRALTRDQSQRYGSARQLARDLERVLAASGETIPTMDLADWMNDLLPQGADQSSRRVKLALNPRYAAAEIVPPIPDESIPPESPGESDEPSPDWVDPTTQVRLVASRATRLILTAQPAVTPGGVALRRQERSPTSDSKFHGLWFQLTLAIVAAVALGLLLRYRAEGELEPLVASSAARTSELRAVPTTPSAGAPSPQLAPRPAIDLPPTTIDIDKPARTAERDSPARAHRAVQPTAAAPANLGSAPTATSTATPSSSAATSDSSTGFVFISASGGVAVIAEDGTRLGQTPIRLSLKVGPHTLLLSPADGGPSQALPVQVKPGAFAMVNVQLASPARAAPTAE